MIRTSAAKGFAKYSGKRIAVVLMCGAKRAILRGRARYEEDRLLGPSLRIGVSSDTNPCVADVIFAENEWHGLIVPGGLHSCDYCFLPAQASGEIGCR